MPRDAPVSVLYASWQRLPIDSEIFVSARPAQKRLTISDRQRRVSRRRLHGVGQALLVDAGPHRRIELGIHVGYPVGSLVETAPVGEPLPQRLAPTVG